MRWRGVRHARAALTYGGDDATALAIAALSFCISVTISRRRPARSLARLPLNGSCATALYFGAHIHAYRGDAALAEEYAVRALRLSPYDALAFEGYYAPGLVRIREQRFDHAAANLARAVQANPRFSVLYVVHAAALALAGRVEEAKSVAKRALELEPNFRVGPWEHVAAKVMLPELWGPLLAGLRQAGLPE